MIYDVLMLTSLAGQKASQVVVQIKGKKGTELVDLG